MRSLLKSLLLAISLLLVCPVAAGASPKDAAAADDLFREGTEAFESGRFDEALRKHRRAWKLSPSFRTAVATGQVELHLGLYRDAATHLSYALAHLPPGIDAELEGHIREGLAKATSHVGALKIEVDAPGVTILVDGEGVGVAPLQGRVFVEPGPHRVEIEGAVTARGRRNVEVAAQATEVVSLSVGPEPGAEPEPRALPKDDAEPASGPSPAAWALISGGTLTVGALVTAGVFAAKASSADNDVGDARARIGSEGCTASTAGDCRALRDKVDDRNVANRVATVAGVTAGVLGAATAVVSAILWPLGAESDHEVAVSVSPSGGSVGVSGAF